MREEFLAQHRVAAGEVFGELADLASDVALKIKYTGFELPPARKAGIKVKSVAELVEKLKSEAKVL